MWESIALDDSPDEDEPDWEFIDQQRFETPNTPSSTSEDAAPPLTYGRRTSDVESDGEPDLPTPRRKPGGYDSRIEQILYENPELPIIITDAGKSVESGGKYIVYTIRTGVCVLSYCADLSITHMQSRTLKSAAAIRSLRRYEMPLPSFILRLSFPQSQRSIPWQTTLRIQPMQSRTSRS
jgi:hypothetical protein